MKIAICDDCISDIKRLEELILQNRKLEKLDFFEFSSGEELLKSDQRFDVIFLDIEMKGNMDGTETAKRLQARGNDTLLSFYTAYDYPASHIVKIRPFSYLMKGSSEEDLRDSLEMILKEATRRMPVFISVPFERGICVLSPADIIYIAIYERGTAIYLAKDKADELNRMTWLHKNGETAMFLVSREKLEVYYEKLKDRGFVFAKKSYIINIQHIVERLKDTVIMSNGTELTVARSRKKEFDEEIMAYWRQFREGM